MIDHIGIPVSDVARATEFYSKALAALSMIGHGGVSRESGHGAAVGFGANLFFWIGEAEGLSGGHVHVAFAAPSRAAVDAFYRAAIAAGGKDNGPPGLRPHYHANYYGAFVLDPDGHNIEAVCHAPALK